MIAATFRSPNYSPPNYDFDTIEVFPSLEDVIEALFDRYSSNGQREIHSEFLDGHSESVLMPNVEAGASFTCYRHNAELPAGDDLEPLDEDVVLEIHTAVHGGWKDYTVTLQTGHFGDVVVEVQKAGI